MLEYSRKNVSCIGSLDVPRGPFDERGLVLIYITLNEALKEVKKARAIIIAEPLNKIGAVRECFAALKVEAQEHGFTIRSPVHQLIFSFGFN